MEADDSEEINIIKNEANALIEPLQEQIYAIQRECKQKIRNLYDKELQFILIQEGVDVNKCVGEIYQKLLNDYYDVFQLEYEAITIDELHEEIQQFVTINIKI